MSAEDAEQIIDGALELELELELEPLSLNDK